jgi:hypothetical protein
MGKGYKFITAYAVTRHYGGPEEGGWWYNWYSIGDAIKKELDYINEGNIYSVLGGVMLDVAAEFFKHEFASTEQPHFC